jgi:hypothetical protein
MFHTHSRTHNQFIILPPPGARVPTNFRRIEFDNHRHRTLLAGMQRLRGKAYLDDGAISRQELTIDGRHQLVDDESCWHVLSLSDDGRVTACLRYLDERHSTGFRALWVSRAALARCPRQGWKLRLAVQSRVDRARATMLGFGSVGGWAVAPEQRRTTEPVAIILATYGLLELLGGCLGVATATFRHQSAAILRKIGLSTLTWSGDALPPYHDPKYGCQMEVLEFDSRSPNPKYRQAVEELKTALLDAPVVCADETKLSHQDVSDVQPGARLRMAVA